MDPLTTLTFARQRIEDLRREAADARRAAEARVAGALEADAAIRRNAASGLFAGARTRMEALSVAGRVVTPGRCPVCLGPLPTGV